MAGSVFIDRVLPLIVFPTLLAAAFKLILGHLSVSGLDIVLRDQCLPGTGQSTPFLLEYTGFKGLDDSLCGFVSFFQETFANPLATKQLGYFAGTGGVFILFLALESSRKRRSALIAFPMAWLFVSQIMTIGITISAYCLVFTLTNNSIPTTKASKKVTQASVEAILAGLIFGGAAPTLALMHYQDPHVSAWWQIYPVYIAIISQIYLFIRPSSTTSGRSFAQTVLLGSFVLSSAFHLYTVLPLIQDTETLKSLFLPSTIPVEPTASAGLKTLDFLRWDFSLGIGSIMAATLWFAQSGLQLFGILAWYIVGSPLLGPSAAATAVLLWREANLQY
ncbi:hypothetical protein FA15DRAFT_704055 [Coprinopsis marcescibilis]|uniref:Uncharacterized protein n=1 Tax=Coprinopsis marcescibilis TaxID=230819 RepID=A0A5C3KXM0_COPMA|nr:hypothetical protein FA15DRAFT_704055 [Coprinopsis marcescibilis]